MTDQTDNSPENQAEAVAQTVETDAHGDVQAAEDHVEAIVAQERTKATDTVHAVVSDMRAHEAKVDAAGYGLGHVLLADFHAFLKRLENLL